MKRQKLSVVEKLRYGGQIQKFQNLPDELQNEKTNKNGAKKEPKSKQIMLKENFLGIQKTWWKEFIYWQA